MMRARKTIYVSYAWESDDQKQIVNNLEYACKQCDITLLRDKYALNYREAIRKDINKLSAGDAMILILSESYFKSAYCMYELCTAHRRQNLHGRIFPMALSGTYFQEAKERIPHIRFWENKKNDLKTLLGSFDEENRRSGFHTEFEEYGEFCRVIENLLAVLGDMNSLTEGINIHSNFDELLDSLQLTGKSLAQQPLYIEGDFGSSKPDWASRIVHNSEGLWVEFERHGRAWPVYWPKWASKLDHDDIGLFADITIKGITQRCRWIPTGTFLMGSPVSEKERYDNETQHQVTLTQGYWLAETACTQAFWRAVMGENPAFFRDDENNPVEEVSWDDVQKFMKQLNTLIPGLAAQLPTEAQWEYACRAGTATPFSFGKNITPEQVNYDGKKPYAGGKKGLYRGRTVPVKSLPANPWGLYEMHGNVWEWCIDWYDDYPATPVTDPTGSETGSSRVLRGGSWSNYAWRTRSANRGWYAPVNRDNYIGFRFVPGQA